MACGSGPCLPCGVCLPAGACSLWLLVCACGCCLPWVGCCLLGSAAVWVCLRSAAAGLCGFAVRAGVAAACFSALPAVLVAAAHQPSLPKPKSGQRQARLDSKAHGALPARRRGLTPRAWDDCWRPADARPPQDARKRHHSLPVAILAQGAPYHGPPACRGGGRWESAPWVRPRRPGSSRWGPARGSPVCSPGAWLALPALWCLSGRAWSPPPSARGPLGYLPRSLLPCFAGGAGRREGHDCRCRLAGAVCPPWGGPSHLFRELELAALLAPPHAQSPCGA